MATKSIGTLNASLSLNTKGFLAGFAQSTKAAQSFSKTMATSVARGVTAAGAKLMAVGTSLQTLKKVFTTAIKDFVKMGEESPAINATVVAFSKLGTQLRAVEKGIFEAAAPALTAFAEAASDAIAEVGKFLSDLGIGFDDVANAANYMGRVAVASLQVMTATLKSNVALAAELFSLLAGDIAGSREARGRGAAAAIEAGAAWKAWMDALAGKGPPLTPRTPFVPPTRKPGKALGPGEKRAPLERGSQEAARMIMELKGNPATNMTHSLLKEIRDRLGVLVTETRRPRNPREAHAFRRGRL